MMHRRNQGRVNRIWNESREKNLNKDECSKAGEPAQQSLCPLGGHPGSTPDTARLLASLPAGWTPRGGDAGRGAVRIVDHAGEQSLEVGVGHHGGIVPARVLQVDVPRWRGGREGGQGVVCEGRSLPQQPSLGTQSGVSCSLCACWPPLPPSTLKSRTPAQDTCLHLPHAGPP